MDSIWSVVPQYSTSRLVDQVVEKTSGSHCIYRSAFVEGWRHCTAITPKAHFSGSSLQTNELSYKEEDPLAWTVKIIKWGKSEIKDAIIINIYVGKTIFDDRSVFVRTEFIVEFLILSELVARVVCFVANG